MSDALAQAFAAEAQRRALDTQALRESITAGVGGSLGAWRTVESWEPVILSGLAQGTYLLRPTAAPLAAAADGSADALFYFQQSYYAVSGYGVRARLRTQFHCNATAPLSTFTTSVVLAGALSGSNAPRVAIGSAPSPAMSCTATSGGSAPAANSKNWNGSSEIDVSGWSPTGYLLQLVVGTADMQAGAQISFRAQLEVRNV